MEYNNVSETITINETIFEKKLLKSNNDNLILKKKN